MGEDDYRGQYPLDITVVPARAVYLVQEGSSAGFRRAVQEACSRWAGATEPIIPVSAKGEIADWYHDVVTLAKVDGAINVNLPQEAAVLAARTIGLPCEPIRMIDRSGTTQRTCHPAWLGEPDTPHQSRVIAREDGDLWQTTAIGDLTDENLSQMDPSTFHVRRCSTDDDAFWPQFSGTTLVERTVVEFEERLGSQALGAAPTILWIANANSLQDCWDFWNARALRPIRFGSLPMFFLPYPDATNWLNVNKVINDKLRRTAEFNPDVLLITSSLTESDLKSAASFLNLTPYSGDVRLRHLYSSELRAEPFTYKIVPDPWPLVSYERRYGKTTQIDVHLFRRGATVRFDSPVKFRAGDTLVRLESPILEGLPRRPSVAALVHETAAWKDDSIQLEMRGYNSYSFPISVPTLQEVAVALLNRTTNKFHVSDKGRLGEGIRETVSLELIRQPKLFETISQLTTPRIKHFISAAQRQLGPDIDLETLKQLATEWGGRSERRMLNAENLRGGASPENVNALESLCALQWAERGLQIKCTVCRLSTFMRLEETGSRGKAQCPGCGSTQKYTTGNADVSLFYRLDTLVDRASDQGVIPHLLTISELENRASPTFFLPGVDLWFPDEPNKNEIDIFGIYDGDVLAGEVKTSGTEFSEKEIRKTVDVASRIDADVLLMAAPDEIPQAATAFARSLCNPEGLELLILDRKNLLPH